MKQRIRLTESQLNRVIKESVRSILRENENIPMGQSDVWDLLEQMKECMSCEDILSRLIARTPNAYEVLEDIFNVECGDYIDEEEDEDYEL